jgi:phosphohistidine swiveling domain-containing protein
MMPDTSIPPLDPRDPTHNPTLPDTYWSTCNFGEAVPGVVTPLGWTIWGRGADRSIREAFYRMGSVRRRELVQIERFDAEPTRRATSAFYGRVAGNANFFATMGDRLPGTSGAAVVEQVYGEVPGGLAFRPIRRRYPVVALKFPYAFVRIGWELPRARAATDPWWRAGVASIPSLTEAAAVPLLAEGAQRYSDNVVLQASHALCSLQPVYEQLTRLVSTVGMDNPNALMGGYGSHAESAVVEDLWLAAHGELELTEVMLRHGYHGPNEGELSATVWREDPAPLQRLLGSYANRARPSESEERLRQQRLRLEAELLGALGSRRPYGRLLLRLLRHSVPLRGVAKAAFLQSLDVARAAARRIGELMVLDGRLDERDDVFFLTLGELTQERPQHPRELVSFRRERFRLFERLELPVAWQGMPTPVAVHGPGRDELEVADGVRGVGVSPGVVEGVIRVVLDPDELDVRPDEILVAPTTDPSWSAVMFISKALIVDIGGALSHAAIVARELGIPCVVNTGNGSRVLRTGDYCRVDGGSGEVQVLTRTLLTTPPRCPDDHPDNRERR